MPPVGPSVTIISPPKNFTYNHRIVIAADCRRIRRTETHIPLGGRDLRDALYLMRFAHSQRDDHRGHNLFTNACARQAKRNGASNGLAHGKRQVVPGCEIASDARSRNSGARTYLRLDVWSSWLDCIAAALGPR